MVITLFKSLKTLKYFDRLDFFQLLHYDVEQKNWKNYFYINDAEFTFNFIISSVVLMNQQ